MAGRKTECNQEKKQTIQKRNVMKVLSIVMAVTTILKKKN